MSGRRGKNRSWQTDENRTSDRSIEAIGLVDSGATVNVLPYELGIQLGAEWDDRKAIIQLSGNLGNQQISISG